MPINKRDIPTLERIFRTPTLHEYYDAGGEVIALTARQATGRKRATVKDVSDQLGLGKRILWDVIRFHRLFDEDMVREAEAMGATWTDIRRFMARVEDPKTAGLAGLREITDS